MFDITPPQPGPDSSADLTDPTDLTDTADTAVPVDTADPADLADVANPADLADLSDPVAGVTGVEVSRRFVRLSLSWLEPMISDLAGDETLLRQPGGIELAQQLFSQRFHRRVDPQVFPLMRRSVPLAGVGTALARVEDLLRTQFADVVGTAAAYLLSHDRDVAIQMATAATTIAGREVRRATAQIITDAGEAAQG